MRSPSVFLLVGLLASTTLAVGAALDPARPKPGRPPLPKVRLAPDGRSFATEDGKPFVPFGVNYYRPGTGWAPQVWKQFDALATRGDFVRMKELGVTCVRVFLTYGSFYQKPGELDPEGLARFEQLLDLADEFGIYIHPTGPDHWEGLPDWAKTDRIADEKVLRALESFWRLLAARYRGRTTIFAYDLLNEPQVGWDSAPIRTKWNGWLSERYGQADKAAQAWGLAPDQIGWGEVPVPPAKDAPGSRQLLDFQQFREGLATDWTRRQAAAIKRADPGALVTVGLIQWSVPTLLPGVQHYAAFRPERLAPHLDFLEVHFYPLDRGAYEYRSAEDEERNLSYLEGVVREVARPGKPVVIAEFGWYGGGQPKFDGGRHPAATEAQQAEWCRKVVEATEGLAVGWLNWGFHDHPQARDVSELTGLLRVDGAPKAWGSEFKNLAARLSQRELLPRQPGPRPMLDWDLAITSVAAGNRFREDYYQVFRGTR